MTTIADGMKIKAIAPWFGSKRNLAPEIVRELGKHKVYWSPFCGSLAVELVKPPCVMETANDLHGDLINLARVLKSEETAQALYARLERTIFHEDLFHEAAERVRVKGEQPADESPDIDRAEDFMLVSWCGRNGVAGTSNYNANFCVRYTANGGHAAKRWGSMADSIPAWHYRLKNFTFLNRDAFGILERIDDSEGTAIYIDPPYLKKGAQYVHDFASTLPESPEPLARRYGDHGRLANALARFKKARVVLSYYDDPALNELYPDWRKRTIEVTKSLVNQGMRDQVGPTKALEVLLVNERERLLF